MDAAKSKALSPQPSGLKYSWSAAACCIAGTERYVGGAVDLNAELACDANSVCNVRSGRCSSARRAR